MNRIVDYIETGILVTATCQVAGRALKLFNKDLGTVGTCLFVGTSLISASAIYTVIESVNKKNKKTRRA